MLRKKPIDWCHYSTLQGSARLRSSETKTKNKLGDRMIKQLLTSVIAKYGDLSVSHRSIIYLSLRLRQIIDLLVTDKSRYLAQPRPIIVVYVIIIIVLIVIIIIFTMYHNSTTQKGIHIPALSVQQKICLISIKLLNAVVRRVLDAPGNSESN